MTTEYEPDPTTDTGEDAASGLVEETGGGLRTKLVEALARVKELEEANDVKTDAIKEKLLDDAFTENGLSRTEGLGKAIALGYEGEPTGEALAQHLVSEYDHEYVGASNPIAAEINTAHGLLDRASMGAGSVPAVPSSNEELARAEATGDYQKTMDMKSDQLGRLMQP